jgi:hypothetical protein
VNGKLPNRLDIRQSVKMPFMPESIFGRPTSTFCKSCWYCWRKAHHPAAGRCFLSQPAIAGRGASSRNFRGRASCPPRPYLPAHRAESASSTNWRPTTARDSIPGDGERSPRYESSVLPVAMTDRLFRGAAGPGPPSQRHHVTSGGLGVHAAASPMFGDSTSCRCAGTRGAAVGALLMSSACAIANHPLRARRLTPSVLEHSHLNRRPRQPADPIERIGRAGSKRRVGLVMPFFAPAAAVTESG